MSESSSFDQPQDFRLSAVGHDGTSRVFQFRHLSTLPAIMEPCEWYDVFSWTDDSWKSEVSVQVKGGQLRVRDRRSDDVLMAIVDGNAGTGPARDCFPSGLSRKRWLVVLAQLLSDLMADAEATS